MAQAPVRLDGMSQFEVRFVLRFLEGVDSAVVTANDAHLFVEAVLRLVRELVNAFDSTCHTTTKGRLPLKAYAST